MPGLSLVLFRRTVIITACFCQSEGTLEALSNAMVSMVSESPAKTL